MKRGYKFFKHIFDKEVKIRTYEIKDFKKYLKKKERYELPINPRKKRLKSYKGCKVFIVNGELIRDNIDIDYVMGGNGFRYLYIPIDEIWVEDKYYKTKEFNYIVYHEHSELKLMRKGLNYSDAHDLASIKELVKRGK